jgi:hypothetical protein
MAESTAPLVGEIEPLDKPLVGQVEDMPEQEGVSFMDGLKSGLTAQPGSGVGHFIGSAIPAGIGGMLGGPIGAALGEAARQTAGAVANPEEVAKQSGIGIGAQVAGAGVMQKAGEAAGPYIAKGAEKAGEVFKGASDWLATRVGKQFIKASKTLNAYGHKPEKALVDEGIFATSWDDLISKVKDISDSLGDSYDEVFSKSVGKKVNINGAITPINTAIREAKKYPETNQAMINKLLSLKRDVIRRIRRSSEEVTEWEVKPSEMAEEWTKDLQTTFGKDLQVINKEVGPVLYTESAKKAGASSDDILEAELLSRKRVVSAEEANNIKREVYKLTKYTGNPSDDAAINKTKQYVAAAINKEVEKAVPGIKPINERYANLNALEKAAEHRAVVAERNNLVGIPEFAATGVLLTGNIPAAIATEVTGRVIGTPTGATAAIKGLSGMGRAAVSPTISKAAQFISQKLGGGISVNYIEDIISKFTPDDIKQSYKTGEIDKPTAAQMLRENHGYQ